MPAKSITKVPPHPTPEVYLSVLGISGLTAYFGFLDVGQPKPGETVVVSTAAGAVGSVVVQLAKIHGCRVIGIAGADEKCAYVTEELGADACINYKTVGNLQKELRRLCPNLVDIYFDNVGGDQLDANMALIAKYGRIVGCGAISGYNSTDGKPKQLTNYSNMIVMAAKYEGFIVTYFTKRFPEALMKLG
jgi:NADPH-dependent curcumin reductase CurA